MVSGRQPPKALCVPPIFLVGSVVIGRPPYSTACCSRRIFSVDSTAGEALRETSTSTNVILAAAAVMKHMSRCPLKVSSLWTQTGRALPPCLAIPKTFSTRPWV